MKKTRVLGTLLAVVMVLSILPITAINSFADTGDHIWVTGITMHSGDYIACNGTEVTDVKPEGGYAYFEINEDGWFLTLNNFTTDNVNDHAITLQDSELNINLVGDNYFYRTLTTYNGSFIFNGTGSLTVTHSSYDGIYTNNGNIIINGGTINVNSGDDGIYASNGDIIINGGTVNVNAPYGFYTYDGMIDINGGNVSITSSQEAIRAYCGSREADDPYTEGIRIDKATVNITTNRHGIYAFGYGVTINGGSVNVESQDSGLNVSNGFLNVNGGKISINSLYKAVYVDGADTGFTINGGDITLSSENTDAIFVYECDMAMSAGKLTVTNANCCVADLDDFYMHGGEFIFDSTEYTDGIYAPGNTIEITGGIIKSLSGENFNTVFNCENLIISGGYVELYGENGVIDAETVEIAESLNPMASTNADGSEATEFDFEALDTYCYFTCGSSYAKGDVNGDGKVNMFDYVAVKSHVLEKSLLSGDKLERADVNGDSKVNMFDYIALKNMVVKG